MDWAMTDTLQIREPFHDTRQQQRADRLGMFIFLATEAMLFGALLLPLAVMRLEAPAAMRAGSELLELSFGTANTAILLTSSAVVALASELAGRGSRHVPALLAISAGLGVLFLVVKGFEYRSDVERGLMPLFGLAAGRSPEIRHFLNLYLVTTAMHALHVTGGVALLGTLAVRTATGATALPSRAMTVEAAGLYWHFVDIVWVFLFPLLYLVRA
jgi:cytochrome c oxidase subunit 3